MECPYQLVTNLKEHGVNRSIRMCFDKINWQFRINDRGDYMECNRGTDKYETKDPSVWKSLVIGHCQNHVMHSLEIKMQRNTKGEYAGLKIETPVFDFSDRYINVAMNCIKEENTYDPFMTFLESEEVEAEAQKIRDTNIIDGKLDDTDFYHWHIANKIIQFEKPENTKGDYFETHPELNKWLLYSMMFPATYLAYKPGDRAAQAVVLVGPEGCF